MCFGVPRGCDVVLMSIDMWSGVVVGLCGIFMLWYVLLFARMMRGVDVVSYGKNVGRCWTRCELFVIK